MEFSASALILYSAVAAVLLLGASTATVWFKQYGRSRESRSAAKAIERYFRKNGVSVTARCTGTGDGRLTAMIEAEPSKRLHRTDDIERALCEYLYNNHGMELDKVYWRIPGSRNLMESDTKPRSKKSKAPEPAGASLLGGTTQIRHLPKVEALDTSWESFAAAADAPSLKRNR